MFYHEIHQGFKFQGKAEVSCSVRLKTYAVMLCLSTCECTENKSCCTSSPTGLHVHVMNRSDACHDNLTQLNLEHVHAYDMDYLYMEIQNCQS